MKELEVNGEPVIVFNTETITDEGIEGYSLIEQPEQFESFSTFWGDFFATFDEVLIGIVMSEEDQEDVEKYKLPNLSALLKEQEEDDGFLQYRMIDYVLIPTNQLKETPTNFYMFLEILEQYLPQEIHKWTDPQTDKGYLVMQY